MAILRDLTGEQFNLLHVVSYSHREGKRKRAYYKCQCECGNSTTVRGENLTSGAVKSCGCLRINNKKSITHGLRKHPLYGTWQNMKNRCYNKKTHSYENYGQRGITVCEMWLHDFQSFYDWAIKNNWGTGLEIDRKDNDLSYHPENCRIVTRQINLFNKGRYSSNTTGYVGISIRTDGRYVSVISIHGTARHIGLFNSIEDAVNARNQYIISHGVNRKIQKVK